MGTYVEAKLIEMSVSVLPQVDTKDTIVTIDQQKIILRLNQLL